MRDKDRIQRIQSLLEVIWQQQPDVRFKHLIYNPQQMLLDKTKEQNFLGKEVDPKFWN